MDVKLRHLDYPIRISTGPVYSSSLVSYSPENIGSKRNAKERRDKRMKYVLQLYNQRNGRNFKLVDAYLSNGFVSSNGTWYHCNFTAKENDDQTRRVFFAEIQGLGTELLGSKVKEILRVRACVILLPGKTTVGCYKCSNVVHPTDGFQEGLKKPTSQYMPLYPSPTLPNYLSKRRPGSPDNTVRFVLPGDERFSIESRRRANIALRCFNERNRTQYELVEALACKGFVCDGCWYHCNFTAKLCNSNIYHMFFAELVSVATPVATPVTTHRSKVVTWVVTACLILGGRGRTADACNLCSGVTHPIQGFSQGIYRSLRKGNSLTVSKTLTEAEQCSVRAEIALESYNRLHRTNYELVEASLSKRFFALTSYWYHCNFYAKRYVSGKYVQRAFFAEMNTLQVESGETLTVTACIPMEGKATFGCHLCSNVVHPTDGFVVGLNLS